MPGHYYIPALYNAAMKISVYECFITHTHIHTHVHAHIHAHTHFIDFILIGTLK